MENENVRWSEEAGEVSDAEEWTAYPRWQSRDSPMLILPRLDYEAQLIAIRAILERNANEESATETRINELVHHINGVGRGNQQYIDEWVDTLSASTYQSAAHSMSAVGMLAPLYESICTQSCDGLKADFRNDIDIAKNAGRGDGSLPDFWNCRRYLKEGEEPREDVYRGFLQFSKSIGLHPFLPESFWKTWSALYQYRNMMLHNGFEWPEKACIGFRKRITECGWEDWFHSATRDEHDWIFFMTDEFIKQGFDEVATLLEGLGDYLEMLFQRALIRPTP